MYSGDEGGAVMGFGGGVPAQPEYGPIHVEGFTYEFRDETLNCPKCEAGRAFFRILFAVTEDGQDWLRVDCRCGFAWNELPADLNARIKTEVLDHFKSVQATAGQVNAIRKRIITAHFTTQTKNAASESGAK